MQTNKEVMAAFRASGIRLQEAMLVHPDSIINPYDVVVSDDELHRLSTARPWYNGEAHPHLVTVPEHTHRFFVRPSLGSLAVVHFCLLIEYAEEHSGIKILPEFVIHEVARNDMILRRKSAMAIDAEWQLKNSEAKTGSSDGS